MAIAPELQAELDRVKAAVEAEKSRDRRQAVCACGHPAGKHTEVAGRWACNALKATCPCRELRVVVRSPNTRIFCFKTDGTGHALLKGWLKAAELGMGEKVDWDEGVTCTECAGQPVTAVALEGGKANEPRCGVHR